MSLWDFLVAIFWFMLLLAWFWLLVTLLSDLFRDDTMSGWGKAAWSLFIIVIPWLGALAYIVVRGSSMRERSREESRQLVEARDARRRADSRPSGPSGELASLADLRDRGVLTPEEFTRAKARVIGGHPVAAADHAAGVTAVDAAGGAVSGGRASAG